MQWLASLSVRRSVFAAVLMMAIFIIGAVAYKSLGVDSFPKVDFPMVTIVTRQFGAGPEEIETEISDKIEAAVNTISGIDELRSVSSDGVSQVIVVFKLEKNGDVATQEVRDHLAQIKSVLPKDADDPIVQKIDPDASPIMYLALKSDRPIDEVTEVADKKVRRDIENISGVGQVSLIGGRLRQINVWINTEAMISYGLTPTDVQRAIVSQNLTAPAGSIETGPRKISLRLNGRVASPEELGKIVVASRADRQIRLEDVARVESSVEEQTTAAAIDEVQALTLSVRKQSGENTVAVAQAVKEKLETIQKNLPAGYELSVVRDGSITIKTMVDAVKEHLILGAVFAALVVLMFLGSMRSTVIAAIAIPVSIVGTFALMSWQGFTLNVITLLALALVVGIVIDDSIVVLENIFRFIHEKKMKPVPAALAATKDIGLAVLATTLSLMAVFIPIAFMGGMVGRIMYSFGITMACAIGVSLIVSFTITPMLASRWLNPPGHRKETTILERLTERFYKPVERVYMVVLGWVMKHRWVVILACILTIASVVPLVGVIQKGFLPVTDEANFAINVRTPEGTSLESTMSTAMRIARDTRRYPGVLYTLTTIGDNQSMTPNLANIYVKLTDPETRTFTQQELMSRIRNEVISKQSKDLRVDVSDVSSMGGSNSKPVQYYLTGPDIDVLGKASAGVVEKLRKVEGAADVDSNLIMGKPEVQIEILRDRAADLGVKVSDIATAVQLLMSGLDVSTYEENGESYDIRIRADKADRTQLAKISMITVPSSKLGQVALREVVSFKDAEGPSEINRINRRRQVTVSANVLPGFGQNVVMGAMQKAIAEEKLPAGYTSAPQGSSKEAGKAVSAFGLAFALAFIFMYLILAMQFDSWLHPATILAILPLTIPFAMLSLLLFNQSLNILSALGLLVLFGVVKKNSILQVDHTINLRAEGMPRDRAILEANRDRLRPILMTTIAFVAGMAPLVVAKGVGSGSSRATSSIIVGGQVLSLVLTLFATPVIYSLMDDLICWFKRHFQKGTPVDRGMDEIRQVDAPDR